MSTLPKPRLTVAEYLEQERAAEFRSEYFNGEVFAMAGGSRHHSLIVGNIAAELWQALRNRPFSVFSKNMRLCVPDTGLYTYPDVMVACACEKDRDQTSDILTDPILLVEVLSPSTQDYDRGRKFEHYRTVESLVEYLTVAQDKTYVEHWVRQPDNRWLLTEHVQPESTISLSFAVDLKMAEIYERVSFDAA